MSPRRLPPVPCLDPDQLLPQQECETQGCKRLWWWEKAAGSQGPPCLDVRASGSGTLLWWHPGPPVPLTLLSTDWLAGVCTELAAADGLYQAEKDVLLGAGSRSPVGLCQGQHPVGMMDNYLLISSSVSPGKAAAPQIDGRTPGGWELPVAVPSTPGCPMPGCSACYKPQR